MKLNDGKNYLKSDMIKPGETLTFLNAGEWIESQKFTYEDGSKRKDFLIQVKYNDKEYALRLNATNRKALVAAYGDETEKWIGSGAKIDVVNVMVSGKMAKSIFLTPDAEAMWK